MSIERQARIGHSNGFWRPTPAAHPQPPPLANPPQHPMKPPRSKLRGIRSKGIGDETPRFLMLFPLYGNP